MGERLTSLSRSVEGRVVLITGAASGIGRATAHLFADEGASVAVTDLSAAAVDDVVAEIVGVGGDAGGWALDVTDSQQIERVVDAVVAQWGRLDILVNNAGVSLGGPIDAADYEDVWVASMDVMITAHQRAIRAALPHLRASDAGRIIGVSSTEGVGGSANTSPYTAAKHAVIGLTRALAVELGEGDLTINAVCPGPIHTGLTDVIPDEMKQKFARRRVPKRRYGHPEELAHAIVNLALPASSYIHGHTLLVDGGMTIKNN